MLSQLEPETTSPPAKPFLKWVGGKSQLLKYLVPQVPRHFCHYFEPFLGGGALFFYLQPPLATLADTNAELIACYQTVRDHVDAVIIALKKFVINQDTFYRVRAQDPSQLSAVEQAARMIFLNRTCYNGLYRVNRQGVFNVPFGFYKNPNICVSHNLRRAAQILRHVNLLHACAMKVALKANRNDVVYFDPPYHVADLKQGFTQYTRSGFGPDAQAELAEVCWQLRGRGVCVIVSNADTPLIRALYRGFCIQKITARRSINCVGSKRTGANEVIITSV